MNISDLNYLEQVPEASDQVQGGSYSSSYFPMLIAQSNTAILYQGASSNSRAFALGGDAMAVSMSTNNSILGQGNF